MKKPFLIATSLSLVVLIAFVYFSQPIKAKADQPTLDYQTTTSSLSDVKAMITGMEAAVIPLVFIVIGFIALTYCTLRNVNVPLQYSSNTSFIDKCSELGHYVFDNATDAIKDVLYSVATFVASGQITDPNRISSTLPFLLKSIGKFFAAFGAWLSSSFINNVQPIARGLLNNFSTTYFANLMDEMTANVNTFLSHSTLVPTFLFDYHANSNDVVYGLLKNSNTALSSYYIVAFNNGFQFYSLDNGNLIKSNVSAMLLSDGCNYYNPIDVSYYDVKNFSNTYFLISNSSIFVFNSSRCRYGLQTLFSFMISLGSQHIRYMDETITAHNHIPDSITLDETQIYNDVITTPWSDQVYTPTDDQTEVDIDDIANKLGEGATIGSLAALIALLTQDKALTLGTAITDVQTINSAGDYNFPSMDNIWKYPQYFFDMLHGWGSFVKGCLGAVTVGEGGLSWIFYGGFVLLICGGIIGKILLG